MKKNKDTIYEIDFVSVVRMFEKQVEIHPDKTAVISGSERKTYGELNAEANREDCSKSEHAQYNH